MRHTWHPLLQALMTLAGRRARGRHGVYQPGSFLHLWGGGGQCAAQPECTNKRGGGVQTFFSRNPKFLSGAPPVSAGCVSNALNRDATTDATRDASSEIEPWIIKIINLSGI